MKQEKKKLKFLFKRVQKKMRPTNENEIIRIDIFIQPQIHALLAHLRHITISCSVCCIVACSVAADYCCLCCYCW